jgi:hypothetical protein
VNSSKILEDVKANVKFKLSALWIVLMFCYTYADILGFYAPGNLEELLSGEIAGIKMTQSMLLGSAILMVIPSIMIFLSLILKARINRIVNLMAGIIYFIVLVSTLFTDKNPSYYLLYATVKGVLLVLIVWLSWKWPRIEA